MRLHQLRAGFLPLPFVPPPQRLSEQPLATPAGFAPATLTLNDGLITAINATMPAAWPALDASGCYVLPGFVDLHIHGSAGGDVMDADPATLAAIATFVATHGVTSFMATTMTAPHRAILHAVATVASAAGHEHTTRQTGARVLGVHVEGPYISPHFPGAQPPASIRPPDLTEFAELLAAGPVRMITLAPEVPGATELIRAARAAGVVVVLGHTNATYEECLAAVALGVSQATHTFNAMRGLHHRQPGALGAVLSQDNIYAQLIADGIHVHPAAIKVLARCKGIGRTLLITDAIRAAGLGAGVYEFAGQTVTVQDGQCRLADGTLAGSILTMDQALVNFMAATGLSLAEAWPVTSRTPAQAIGLQAEIGSLRPGARADLVLLDHQLGVVATVVGGEVVYLREPERYRTSG